MSGPADPGQRAGPHRRPPVRMWEARAADGHGDDLVAWALAASAGRGAQVLRSRGQDAERVVVVLDDGGPPLPDPPDALVARPPGAWIFDRVG